MFEIGFLVLEAVVYATGVFFWIAVLIAALLWSVGRLPVKFGVMTEEDLTEDEKAQFAAAIERHRARNQAAKERVDE